MQTNLDELLRSALRSISEASSKEDIEEVRVRYLGRKGRVTSLFKTLSGLGPEERKKAGEEINRAKRAIEEGIKKRSEELEARERAEKLASERLDVTLPGRATPAGRLHPVTQITDEIVEVFRGLGFSVAEGPEVETDYYNFEALNIPKDHPAREMQDTFYISGDLVLRTHTSPVQIRVMESVRPPVRVIAPGTVYRRDSDITHTPMFHQIEGFMVEKNVSFSDLKGVLTYFLHRLFGAARPVRFRPSFFPFTEPSAEVDVRCVICEGSGCRVCKETGWLEILGAGMIHPEVLRAVKYDPEEFSGFAFGLGIERIAMLRFGIDDIRLFFENDIRFLEQF